MHPPLEVAVETVKTFQLYKKPCKLRLQGFENNFNFYLGKLPVPPLLISGGPLPVPVPTTGPV